MKGCTNLRRISVDKAEPKYWKVGNRSKWAYIPYGSDINPFFPKENVPVVDINNNTPVSINNSASDNTVTKSMDKIPSPKPFSIFAKYKPDDEDYDPDFLKDGLKQGIAHEYSTDALSQDENQDSANDMDGLLIKILSNPTLDFLGKMIVKRRLTPDTILNFSEPDWKRFGIMDRKDRSLIQQYLRLAKKNNQ